MRPEETLRIQKKEAKTTILTIITSSYDIFWFIFQIIMMTKYNSSFFLAPALFSLLHCVSKLLCLLAIYTKNRKFTNALILLVSGLIIVSGIFYMNYILRVCFGEGSIIQNRILNLSVCVFSFICMALSIVSIFHISGTSEAFKTMKVMGLINTTSQAILTLFTILNMNNIQLGNGFYLFVALFVGLFTVGLGLFNLLRLKSSALPIN